MAVPKYPSLRCLRSFSTTLHTAKPATQSHPPRYTRGPPPYPYGPALHYKQSDSGLYGGASIQFGNKVSEKNALKSRRAWRPNIHSKRLWSDALGRFVHVKVQARVLRTVDKCGGLDEYLLGEKPGRVKELGVEGWRLRWLVMGTGKVRRRVGAEREALGLVGRGSAMGQKRSEGGKVDSLEEEVERASGEVVAHIEGSEGGPSKPGEEAGHMETALETRINHLTHALEAEAARRASQARKPTPPLPANALPSHTDVLEDEPRGRRYTKGEKRAWRAAQGRRKLGLGLDLDSTSSYLAGEWGEERVGKQVEEIEEAVDAAMEGADEEGRERLEVAMEGLRSAREELEGVGASEAVELRREEEGRGGSEGGVLGKIKGFFRRR